MSATAATAKAPSGVSARTSFARGALVLVALGQLEIGVWGELAPHSFWASFPGFGRHWVSALGAYDEHLLRDFAAAELGLAVLLLCAAIWFERRLVLVAGATFLAATVPHFVFHLVHTDPLPAADNVASLGSFALEIVVVAFAMVVAATVPAPGPPLRDPRGDG